MTTDLWCVVAVSVWGLLLAYVPVLGRVLQAGARWGFGNREQPVEGAPWVQRADRAYANHIATLAPFVAVALVAHLSAERDDVTATASVVFVVGRVLHSLLYVFGVPWLRTFAFWASIGAVAVIVARLF